MHTFDCVFLLKEWTAILHLDWKTEKEREIFFKILSGTSNSQAKTTCHLDSSKHYVNCRFTLQLYDNS